MNYSGILKGIQFELKYNPDLVTIGAPALSLMQENVIITHSKISDGHMKVIVADLSGETVESNQQDLVKIPYSFNGEITEVSGISLNDIYVSGPKGKIADVSSRSVSADVKLVPACSPCIRTILILLTLKQRSDLIFLRQLLWIFPYIILWVKR